MAQDETKRALIVARTYPVPASPGIESSCTAAITDRGEWLRIFPVPWRLLAQDQRFRKYQWVDLIVTKARDDYRVESYHLKPDGISIVSALGTEKGWRARKNIVLPLQSHCLCCLTKLRDQQQYPTLGIIRPESILKLRLIPDTPNWTDAQLAMLRQQNFFVEAPREELKKLPLKFCYQFRCPESDCNGHTLMCTDWEMGQSYRKWRTEYGEQGCERAFRQKYESEMIHKTDTHFFVGTVASHPNRWIIIGLFYPPRQQDDQPTLF
jgi:hypothetical protein